MKGIKLLISILVILLGVSASVWTGEETQCWAQSAEIIISVAGNIVKIRGYYKNYQLSVLAVTNMINKRTLEAIRSGTLNHFASDPIPWTPGVGRQIVESELALQWGVVEYLERIYQQKDPTKLRKIKVIKESLLSSTEVLEKTKLLGTRAIVDKSFYNNLTSINRRYLEELLKPL